MTALSSPTAHATTLPQVLLAAVDNHRRTAMRVRRDGALQETSFADLGKAAREIAGGLIAHGVRSRAVCRSTRSFGLLHRIPDRRSRSCGT